MNADPDTIDVARELRQKLRQKLTSTPWMTQRR